MALRHYRFIGGSAASCTVRHAASWAAATPPHKQLSSTAPARATARRRQRARAARNAPTCVTSSVGSDLVGTPKGRLRDAFARLGLSSQLAEKVVVDVHRHGAQSLDDLSVSSDNKALLHDHGFHVSTGRVVTRQDSSDGTVKWLIDVGDGLTAETVFIPVEGSETSRSRGTLCVSSQAGCSLSCKFCFTGTMPLIKNLSAAQIALQLLTARRELGCFPLASGGDNDLVSNVVFMGQGEPLYNWRNVAAAVDVMTDRLMGRIAPKRLTVSTSGVSPKMEDVGSVLGVNLALSLHAVNDRVRSAIMPINNTYNLAAVLEACRNYTRTGRKRRVMFEYVMLRGVNDSHEDAVELARIASSMPTHVNLIPFNPFPGSVFECSTPERMEEFSRTVMDAGVTCVLRATRGQDILAACGQLNSTKTGNVASDGGVLQSQTLSAH